MEKAAGETPASSGVQVAEAHQYPNTLTAELRSFSITDQMDPSKRSSNSRQETGSSGEART